MSRNIGLSTFLVNNKKASKNIFIIGIDGMMSSKMYTTYFERYNPTYFALKKLGFSIYDIYSAGESTLETYSSLFSYNKIHPRVSRQIFMSPRTQFYVDAKSLGYKIQFNFATNYFGGDPNMIFDSYYPKTIKTLSFTMYTDPRWGWYLVKFLNWLQGVSNVSSRAESQVEMVINEIGKIDLSKNKWFSISHIWYPGHTTSNYNFKNSESFENFKSYYISSQEKLIDYCKKIFNVIINKDSNAIIIFMGDHGSYLLKGATEGDKVNKTNVSKELFSRDKNEVLFAIYPKGILTKFDINKIINSPEKTLEIIISKSLQID